MRDTMNASFGVNDHDISSSIGFVSVGIALAAIEGAGKGSRGFGAGRCGVAGRDLADGEDGARGGGTIGKPPLDARRGGTS